MLPDETTESVRTLLPPPWGALAPLIAESEAEARPHFDVLLLRTDTAAAARFYERLGYAALPPGGRATHRRALPEGPGEAPGGVP